MDAYKKILAGVLVSILSVCLFFTFGFWVDIDNMNGDGLEASISFTDESPPDEDAEEGEEGEDGEEGAGDEEDTEDGEEDAEEDEEDTDDGNVEKVYHIITNSNMGGFIGRMLAMQTADEGEEEDETGLEEEEVVFWDTEGNHTGTEGESFTFSYFSLEGYSLEYLRIGNTKYYPGEYNEPIYFKKNLTIHAHFKKVKEETVEEGSEEENPEVGEDTSLVDNSNNGNGNGNNGKANGNNGNGNGKDKANNGHGKGKNKKNK